MVTIKEDGLCLSQAYDRSKTIIMMGKGPSCRQIDQSDDYYVACANTAGRLAEHVDFQFAGDGGYCVDTLKLYGENIDNLIIPTEFNLENEAHLTSLTFLSLTDLVMLQDNDGVFIANPHNVIRIHEFVFSFHKERYNITDTCRMYDVVSTGEQAIKWLVDEGFRNFKSVGMDPDAGDHARHNVFIEHGDCRIWPTGGTWAEQTNARAMTAVEAVGGTWERI